MFTQPPPCVERSGSPCYSLSACLCCFPTAQPPLAARTSPSRPQATVVARASNRLAGAATGRPQLVHDEQGKPGYYVVPAHKHGRVVGLVGVSLSGREWQWYSDGYKEQKFPVISQGEAERALGGPAVLTAAPDKHMYWGRSGRLLSAERPGKVVAAASVISTDVGAADVSDSRLGSSAERESRDPVRSDDGVNV
ncbi:MAG: hypothetical protein WKH64_10570, partial [Chloroflexia bacterium]